MYSKLSGFTHIYQLMVLGRMTWTQTCHKPFAYVYYYCIGAALCWGVGGACSLDIILDKLQVTNKEVSYVAIVVLGQTCAC